MAEDLEERTRRGETRSFYRVPSKGVTTTQRRIAQAVDNEAWQHFRHSLKGITTKDKLDRLKNYWEAPSHVSQIQTENTHDAEHEAGNCDICIRVSNYIGALCRGGQLSAGARLQDLLADELVILK